MIHTINNQSILLFLSHLIPFWLTILYNNYTKIN